MNLKYVIYICPGFIFIMSVLLQIKGDTQNAIFFMLMAIFLILQIMLIQMHQMHQDNMRSLTLIKYNNSGE